MTEPCPDKTLLIQAHHDGELDAAESASLMAHTAACPGCAELQATLGDLSRGLRLQAPTFTAPPSLRRKMQPLAKPRAVPAIAFCLGALLAAGVVLLLPSAPVGDDLVSGHIRALQPGHLTDVLSADQHTVKPWFDGRLDYAPPVRDLAASGFPLVGGRLDYLEKRPVAALVYRRDKHVIDLFVWPGTDTHASSRSVQGYNIVSWGSDGMVFRAISDLAPADLAAFAQNWRAMP